MDSTISKNGGIIFYNEVNMNFYIKRMLMVKSSMNFSLSPINYIAYESVAISNDTKLKYNYITRLDNSNIVSNNNQFLETNSAVNNSFLSDDSINLEFIENYSLKYV